ncbi:MAG: acyl-CoA thioesterase [Cyclobacteriaceae bacterium]|nr:acyl-CoA thioesterase [Cyclobacteriaceae bacterium]
MNKQLKVSKEIVIRFSEVDSLGIVWHGNHVKYFEDGREEFGKQFGLGYMDVYRKGFLLPITSIHCDYKRPIEYEKPVIVEVVYVPVQAAKIIFDYTLLDKKSCTKLATGRTEQVFLDTNKELYLTNPDFYIDWKLKNGVSQEDKIK